MPLEGKSGNVQRISICDGSVLSSESAEERRYLTNDHVICLMPSAGIDAPSGGEVTVMPTVNTPRIPLIPITEERNTVKAARMR